MAAESQGCTSFPSYLVLLWIVHFNRDGMPSLHWHGWETCLAGRDREISRRPHSQWPCDRVLLSNPATSWCYRHRNVAIGKTKPCDDALPLAEGMPPNSVKVLSRSNPSTLWIWRLSWDRHITPAPIVMCCSNYCASFNISYWRAMRQCLHSTQTN